MVRSYAAGGRKRSVLALDRTKLQLAQRDYDGRLIVFSDFLRDLLNPIVVIRAENGELVFVSKKLEVRQLPLIRVTDDHRILDYGRAAVRGEDGRLIRLLEGSPDPDALAVFCRYHLKMFVSTDALRRRPQVVLEQAAIRREFGPDAPEALRSAMASDGNKVKLTP